MDRLISFKTVIQAVGILVIATVAGLSYNSVRGEGKVEFGRQYLPKQAAEQKLAKSGKTPKNPPVTPLANGGTEINPAKDPTTTSGGNPAGSTGTTPVVPTQDPEIATGGTGEVETTPPTPPAGRTGPARRRPPADGSPRLQ